MRAACPLQVVEAWPGCRDHATLSSSRLSCAVVDSWRVLQQGTDVTRYPACGLCCGRTVWEPQCRQGKRPSPQPSACTAPRPSWYRTMHGSLAQRSAVQWGCHDPPPCSAGMRCQSKRCGKPMSCGVGSFGPGRALGARGSAMDGGAPGGILETAVRSFRTSSPPARSAPSSMHCWHWVHA